MKVRYFLYGLLVALWGFLGYVPVVWASSSSGVSVTVPASVGVVFEEDGSCSIPEVSVINDSLVPVRLEGVSVGSRSGWSLVSSGSSIPLDSKKISLNILGVDVVEGFNPLSLDVLEGSSEVIDFSIGRGAWSEGIGVEDAFSLSFRYSLGKRDFTVSFDSAGGGVVSSVVDKNGSSIVLPDCIREGYTFEGWLDSDGVLYKPNENYIVPIGGSSLTGTWIPNSYDVNFNSNLVTKSYVDEFYGNLSRWVSHPSSTNIGTVSIKQDSSTEDGYCVEYTPTTVVDSDWAGFWLNTNTFIPLTPGKTYTYSAKFKASKKFTTARLGFEQGGYVDSDVGTEWVNITKTFVADSSSSKNFIFYTKDGQLSVGDKLYVADFRFMEGSPEVITQSKPFESELGTLPNPSSVTGYSFNGWYDSRFGGSPVSPSKKVPLNGLTCFGYWSPSNVNYTVNHYLMNLDGTTYSLDSSESKSAPSNRVLDLSTLDKTFTGFTFLEGKVGGSVKSYTNVLPDGSRVIDLYYSRNKNVLDVNGYVDGVYGKWVKDVGTFDITVNSVKQTGIEDYCKELYYGSTYEVSNVKPKPGYVFDGYHQGVHENYGTYDGSPSGVLRDDNGDGRVCVGLTFSTIDYSISYDLAGGRLPSPINSYKVTTDDFTLPTPSRTGFIFLGWTGSNGSTPELTVTIPKGSTGNKSYTANWGYDIYTVDVDGVIDGVDVPSMTRSQISFNVYNGDDLWADYKSEFKQSFRVGFNLSLKSINPGAGLRYVGWSTNLDGGAIHPLEEPIDIVVGGKDKVLKIYLHLESIDYTVQYDGNGATSGSMGTTSVKYGVPTPLEKNKFVKEGHTFLGWNAKRKSDNRVVYVNPNDSNDTQWYVEGQQPSGWKKHIYQDEVTVSKITATDGDVIIMTAVWQINSYYVDINYYLNNTYNTSGGDSYFSCDVYVNGSLVKGGTGDYYTKHPYGTEIEFRNIQAKPGYKITGWKYSNDSSFKSPSTSIKFKVTPNTSVVYFNVESITYTVQYDGNGATSGSMGTTVVKYGVNTPLASNKFVRNDGYQFVGWIAKRKSDGKILYANPNDENANNWYLEGQQPYRWEKYVYKDNEGISKTTTVDGDVVTMSAVWEEFTCTLNIRYEFEDGTPVPNSIITAGNHSGLYISTKYGAWYLNSLNEPFSFGEEVDVHCMGVGDSNYICRDFILDGVRTNNFGLQGLNSMTLKMSKPNHDLIYIVTPIS